MLTVAFQSLPDKIAAFGLLAAIAACTQAPSAKKALPSHPANTSAEFWKNNKIVGAREFISLVAPHMPG